jgi:Phage tail sheath protein subtilisin-like domain
MPSPGVTVTTREFPVPLTIPTDVGQCFMVGITEWGPEPQDLEFKDLCYNIDDVKKKFIPSGAASAESSMLYRSADGYFKQGGHSIYLCRVTSSGDVAATEDIVDSTAGVVFAASAKYKGVGGNNIDIVVDDHASDPTIPTGSFRIMVMNGSTTLETSPPLADKVAAGGWASSSKWITLTEGASANDPVADSYSLAGGASGAATADDDDWQAAMDEISSDLGPGQICQPGRTTDAAHVQIANHDLLYNRVGMFDPPDTHDVATLLASANIIDQTGIRHRYGGYWGGWPLVAGEVSGTVQKVPPSAMVAGLMSYNDGRGLSPNDPSAGTNGILKGVVGVSQQWSDAERKELNEGGVNVIKSRYGVTQVYGYRSTADPVSDERWIPLGNIRLHRLIVAQSAEVGEWFVFKQIDGKGVLVTEFGSTLSTHVMLPLYNANALFGDSPGEAYNVNVGPSVNTPETIAANELHAVITVKMSPFGEDVFIEIVKLLITEEVPA